MTAFSQAIESTPRAAPAPVRAVPVKPLVHVPVAPVTPDLFREVVDPLSFRELLVAMVRSRSTLQGRVIWNVNSTARGGGVAEILQSLVAYARGAGLDTRWSVVQGNPAFFRITKRIHNQIQGFPGDGGPLGGAEHDEYEESLAPALRALLLIVHPEDVVILHDPQTAGLIPGLKGLGARLIWRCHVGVDDPNETAARAWEFLVPYVERADAYVFSRASFIWRGLDRARATVIPPSIDPFTPKNEDLSRARGASILIQAGLLSGYSAELPIFLRSGFRTDFVAGRADVVETAPPPLRSRLVVQVSRWDRLKDPIGVMNGFANHVDAPEDVHLVLAGPQTGAVSDDPEATAVLDEAAAMWKGLPERVRRRIHLASLPMDDPEENGAIVNALQRRAEVVVQKSVAEGFGLTVAEAMWKARPVVASNVGGIGDQVEHERTGLLLDDPSDLQAFGRHVSRLLSRPDEAAAMGAAGREAVRRHFLSHRHLIQYADLLLHLES